MRVQVAVTGSDAQNSLVGPYPVPTKAESLIAKAVAKATGVPP